MHREWDREMCSVSVYIVRKWYAVRLLKTKNGNNNNKNDYDKKMMKEVGSFAEKKVKQELIVYKNI